MKRILSSVAMLVACVSAQGQSSVTIYGLLDAAMTSAKTSNGTRLPGGGAVVSGSSVLRMDSGVGPGGSRLGFRGVEDLGGGLVARFVLEGGPAVDTGAYQQGGLPFGRQVFVGLGSNKVWSVTAGRQYTPINNEFALSVPTYGFYWGNPLTNSGFGIYESVAEAPGSGFFQATGRMDNSVLFDAYLGKFTANLMIAPGNENPRKTGRYINPAISYVDGPLAIRASYAQFKQGAASIAPGAQPEWLKQFVLGGSYNFGVVHAFAGVFGFNGPQNPANLSPAATVGSPTANVFSYSWQKQRSAWVGARIPLGSGTLMTSVLRNKLDYATGPDGKSTSFLLAYEHPLSKRTLLYGSYGNMKNDAFTNTPLVATVVAVPASGFGSDVRAMSLGVRHTF